MNKVNFRIAYVDPPWSVFHISEHVVCKKGRNENRKKVN